MLDDFVHLDRIHHYWNLVNQTAEFRYKVSWTGARELLADRGFAADKIMRCTCDQGDDICAGLLLSNNLYVRCEFRENPDSRRLISISSWRQWPLDSEDDEEARLASEIFSSPDLKDAFDRAVEAFYDFHFKPEERAV